jgi:hypothetical protein
MERIRKQIYELTQTDLIQYPIWEYALDEEGYEGQDEKTVRPYIGSLLFDPSKIYSIVRASYFLADGTQLKGYIKPIGDKNRLLSPALPYDYAPSIVTEDKQLHLCCGSFQPTTDKVNEFYKSLGKKSEDVFPLKFSSDIKVYGQVIEGEVDGLMYFSEETDLYKAQADNIRTIR